MKNTEIPNVLKLAVLNKELEQLCLLRYQLEVRHRVNMRIGSQQSQLDAIAKELETCEKAIDAYRAELDALGKENKT